MNNGNSSTKTIAKLGVLAAVSIVLVALIHFPIIPTVSFLEYDPADIPILLGTFALGPGAGFALTVVVALIQGFTVSAASSWYGIVMHVIATGSYVLVAGNVYKHKKTKKGAITALALGTLAWIIVMIPANLFITPIYLEMIGGTKIPMSTMLTLIPYITLFNAIKAILNSVITFLVYKKTSPILHR